uniref:Uncharacterized protein n=1 Tax=Eutreptiella gymnastica TaxID=73025 RepID=A0A7S4CRB7_9EUGL
MLHSAWSCRGFPSELWCWCGRFHERVFADACHMNDASEQINSSERMQQLKRMALFNRLSLAKAPSMLFGFQPQMVQSNPKMRSYLDRMCRTPFTHALADSTPHKSPPAARFRVNRTLGLSGVVGGRSGSYVCQA